jgi:hypothetical protein
MSGFNNIGCIYSDDNSVHCTGFVVRKAISERDISLIITSHSNINHVDIVDKKMFVRFDNGKTTEIKLHVINNGIVFFMPIIPLYDVVEGSCSFNMYNNNYYGYKKDTTYYLWKYDGYIRQVSSSSNDEYFDADGMIVANFEGVVVGMIVDNKIMNHKDIQNILSKVLDDYFEH